jgi:hypothetical protein
VSPRRSLWSHVSDLDASGRGVTGRLTARDTLDTTTTGETPDGRLGNTLNVVTKNLPVALGTTLAEALAALAACENVSNRRRES